MTYPWFKRRRYLHFDLPVSEADAAALVTNSERIAAHAFYPFLFFVKSTRKVRRDPETGRIQPRKKDRPLSIASHADAHVFAYYCELLTARYEAELHRRGLDDVVLAFRRGKGNNVTFAQRAFDEIRRRQSCAAIALDIKGFFDHLDHTRLKQAWSAVLGRPGARLPDDHYQVYRAITHYAFVDMDKLEARLDVSRRRRQSRKRRLCDPDFFRERVRGEGLIEVNANSYGIPQGSPISALLSNVYMLEFDQWLAREVARIGGRYFRYCDDLLVIVDAAAAIDIIDKITGRIHAERLTIQSEKTQTSNFALNVDKGKVTCDRPLQYLGFTFDGTRTLIRSGSIARYRAKTNRGIRVAIATMKNRNEIRASRGEAPRKLFVKKLYRRFAPVGRRNFASYGYKAARSMASPSIRRQLRRHWPSMRQKIGKV